MSLNCIFFALDFFFVFFNKCLKLLHRALLFILPEIKLLYHTATCCKWTINQQVTMLLSNSENIFHKTTSLVFFDISHNILSWLKVFMDLSMTALPLFLFCMDLCPQRGNMTIEGTRKWAEATPGENKLHVSGSLEGI